MAPMLLRLSDEDSEALRRKADAEGVSMHSIAISAVRAALDERPSRLAMVVDGILERDAKLIHRLGQ